MNLIDEIKNLRKYYADQNLRLLSIRRIAKSPVQNLNDLGDVNAPAPNDNDALTYDAATGKWIPEAAGGGGVSELDIQYLDTFADGSVHWTWCQEANNGSITESGSVVTLAVANGVDGRTGVGGRLRGPYMSIGGPGCPLEIKCKLNSFTVNNCVDAGLFISSDTHSGAGAYWFILSRYRYDGEGRDGLVAWCNGVLNYAPVTTLPIYLRIRVNALDLHNCIKAAYSTDDVSYTVLRQAGLDSNMYTDYKEGLSIGIEARNGMDSGTYNAISAPFEWFYARRSFGPG